MTRQSSGKEDKSKRGPRGEGSVYQRSDGRWVAQVPLEDGGRKLLYRKTEVETEPKTAEGRRKIILPDFVLEALKQHRMQQLELRLKVGADWQEQDYVFTGLKGGPLNPRYILKLFDRLLKEAGLPHMRFHDLRHSATTLLLSMGVNAEVVQEILGHSNISMTMDVYSHVLPSMHKDAMGKWDDAFGTS